MSPLSTGERALVQAVEGIEVLSGAPHDIETQNCLRERVPVNVEIRPEGSARFVDFNAHANLSHRVPVVTPRGLESTATRRDLGSFFQ
jgi:hypothetical protein